jgi:transposase InsO family protein
MNENIEAGKKGKRAGLKGKLGKVRRKFEEKLGLVRLHLQEGHTLAMVSQETGVPVSTISGWVRRYRREGEAGLEPAAPPRGGSRLAPAVREKIIELKRETPWHGVKRISQVLRRMFFLQASPESVRRALHAAELMPAVKEKKEPNRNMSRPRRFERATPNQMWQTDIFTFRLGGRFAYLVAFMDDYSRYIVGLMLMRSPTSAAVIEAFRVAAGEYGLPKEMLTDRGPQYTNWRGKSRFEREMAKERIIHIKSRPQHPMTLGKVERFWSTIWTEFLSRAQFDSFENARERIVAWVKHYNHRRPNQGIEGMCPADRFFEVAHELRKTIEKGIAENVLELALRGQPRAPFYMVGRMDGQSVVLHAEKGKIKLSVDDAEGKTTREATWDIKKGTDGEREEQRTQTQAHAEPGVQRDGEVPGGVVGVDGAVPAGGRVPGDGHQLDAPEALAGPSDGGHAPGAGEQGGSGRGLGADAAAAGALGEAPNGGRPEPAGSAARPASGCEEENGDDLTRSDHESEGYHRPRACDNDRAGPGWKDDGEGGGAGAGSGAEDLPRVGETGVGGDDGRAHESGAGSAVDGAGSRGAAAPTPGQGVGDQGHDHGGDGGAPGAPAGGEDPERAS